MLDLEAVRTGPPLRLSCRKRGSLSLAVFSLFANLLMLTGPLFMLPGL